MTKLHRDDRFRHFIEKKYRHDPAHVWVTTVTYDDGSEEFATFDFDRGGAMDSASDVTDSNFLTGDYERIVRVTVARVPTASLAALVAGQSVPKASTGRNGRPAVKVA